MTPSLARTAPSTSPSTTARPTSCMNMVQHAARPPRVSKQARTSHSRLNADRRMHSRSGSSRSRALQFQREQSYTSSAYDSNSSVTPMSSTTPGGTSPFMTLDSSKSGDMPQLLDQSSCMTDVIPDLSATSVPHMDNSYDSLLPHRNAIDVFDFQGALPIVDHFSNQYNQGGSMTSDFVDSLLSTDLEQPGASPHCASCCCGSTSSKTAASTVDSTSSPEERLDFVVDSVRNAGFRDMDDMVLSYYTEAFDEDSHIFHEQRMSRQRGLPTMLSKLHLSAAAWQEYEREAYQAQVLENAESLLVDECRGLFHSPGFKELLAHMRSSAINSPAKSSSPYSTYHSPHDAGSSSSIVNTPASSCSASSISHPKAWLSEELPNVWKLVSALSGCRAGSQSVANLLLTLCSVGHLQAEEVRQLLQSTAT